MMIPFDGVQPQTNQQDLKFDDILKGMGLEDDVADILDGNSDEEEEKQINTRSQRNDDDGFYGGGIGGPPKPKGVEIISSTMREKAREQEQEKECGRKPVANTKDSEPD